MTNEACARCKRDRVERACACRGCDARIAICACPDVMDALVGSRGLCAACRRAGCAPAKGCRRAEAAQAKTATTRRLRRSTGGHRGGGEGGGAARS